MIEQSLHDQDYLGICKHYRAVYNTGSVQADEVTGHKFKLLEKLTPPPKKKNQNNLKKEYYCLICKKRIIKLSSWSRGYRCFLLFIKCNYVKEPGKFNGEMFKGLESKWLKKVNNEHAQKEYYKLF